MIISDVISLGSTHRLSDENEVIRTVEYVDVMVTKDWEQSTRFVNTKVQEVANSFEEDETRVYNLWKMLVLSIRHHV